MKKLFTLAALFCLALSVNAQEMPRHKKPKQTQDANVLDVTKNEGTIIEYKTPAEIKAEFEKRAELNMWTAEQKEKEAAKLLTKGYLLLRVSRLTLDAANPKFFTVIIQDETGKEISRQQMKDAVPDYKDRDGSILWESYSGALVPTELKTGSKVFVIDAIKQNRHEYLIQN